MLFLLFFFFQAEDGIRDLTVTGVQTCALPISGGAHRARPGEGIGEAGQRDRQDRRGEAEGVLRGLRPAGTAVREGRLDRKSTRLNSSHSQISYAVFCLKKKNRTNVSEEGRSRG